MTKKTVKINIVRSRFLGIVFCFLLLAFFPLAFFLFYYQRIYPQVYIGNFNIGGKSKSEALLILQNQISLPTALVFSNNEKEWEYPLPQEFSYNFEATVQNAYDIGRTGGIEGMLKDFKLIIGKKIQLPLNYNLPKEFLDNTLDNLAKNIFQEPILPSVSLANGEIVVNKGGPGEEIDRNAIINKIDTNLKYNSASNIQLLTKTIDPTITDIEALIYKDRAVNILNKTLVISVDNTSQNFTKDSLLNLLKPGNSYYEENINLLVDKISSSMERGAVNPVFNFQDGKVIEFSAGHDGIKVRKPELAQKITDGLKTLESTDKDSVNVDVPVVITPPDFSVNEINNLGIKGIIGKGTSKYSGSIASRIHNIALASTKFNGVLIPPGETFSFNKTLGEVSSSTGYQQAYVIKEGATVLGDGGGVCQVSTTLFRAAINAGLPIVERKAHSYRVGYYEQDSPPGIDATVYEPSPDFKFKNDTPSHILIQAMADTKARTLVFEIYGTADGRVATVSKPVVTGVTPPPEDLYIDDPSLPSGQIKQIDWKAWGAKVWFDYKVARNGETIFEKRFQSNYMPWQAKYLRGTGPAQ